MRLEPDRCGQQVLVCDGEGDERQIAESEAGEAGVVLYDERLQRQSR